MVVSQFVLYLILLSYFVLVAVLSRYFSMPGRFSFWSEPNDDSAPITVIVPFKNESENLPHLLSSLDDALRNHQKAEVLFVDDHSTDDGRQLIESFGNEFFTIVNNEGNGKKAAIETGVKKANHDFIFLTDADCVLPEKLFDLNTGNGHENIVVCGAVIVENGRGIAAAFQHIESLVLAFLAGSCIKAGIPLTGSAAHLFFSKKGFEALNPFDGNRDISSGDDHYFIQKAAAHSSFKVLWNESPYPVVTRPQLSLNGLIRQKARWASKLKAKGGVMPVLTGFYLLAVQSAFITSVILGFVYSGAVFPALALGKVLTDIMLFMKPKKQYKSKISLVAVCFAALAYPLYFVVVLVAALGRNPKSKHK